ncbi:MAG: HTH domain-containing protein [Bacillota bacterium]
MKSKRLMELARYIETRDRFTVQELADRFGVSYRTMWRDLQELSELGVPLYSEPGVTGGYRLLRSGRSGPPGPKGEMIHLPAFQAVGFSFTAPYTARADAGVLVPRLWMRLLSRVEEIRHCVDPSVRLGLSVHHPREFTYYITVQVSAIEAVPDDMVSLSVAARRYARFLHVGSMERERVDATFLAAFAWIESKGLTRSREAPWVERYDHRYDPASPRNAFEILLPVD